jgi:hypothetical protein
LSSGITSEIALAARVDRRHEALDDPELLEQDLGHRGQAVRRARGVGDDVVLRRVVVAVVDAHDDREVLVLRRGGDDDLLRATVDVRLGLGRVREVTGRLDDDVGAELAPRQRGGVTLGQSLEALAADGDRGLVERDVLAEPAQDRVVLQQVRERLVVRQVVDTDDLDVSVRGQQGAEVVAADAAEAVDAYPYCHRGALPGTPGVRPA